MSNGCIILLNFIVLQIIYFYASFAKEKTVIQMLQDNSSSNEIHSDILSSFEVSVARFIDY